MTLVDELLREAVETLRFNATHLIAEDDKADALHTLECARQVMYEVADALAAWNRRPPIAVDGQMIERALDAEDGISEWPAKTYRQRAMRAALTAALAIETEDVGK